MSTPVDFYFDFSSPYGYFASTRIDALAQKHGRIVRWHPVLLGVVFKTTGSAPLSTYPLKGEYAMHDFERTARFHGIPYRKPEEFPISTQLAARSKLWIEKNMGADKAIEFCKGVYQAYFVEGLNITKTDVIAEVAARKNIDGTAVVEGSGNILVKEELKNQIEIAMAKGVFGSPFIIVDKEPFWGFDRFDQLEAFLKNGKI